MKLTIDQIRASELDVLTPEMVGAILKIKPCKVREYARTGQFADMFPCVCSGNRVKFPKSGFLNWCDGRNCND